MESEKIEVDLKENNHIGRKLLPLILTFAVIIIDQITKGLVVKFIPQYYTSGKAINIFGNALRLIHVRNNAVAFSMGSGLSDGTRHVLFAIIPLLVIAAIFVFYFISNEFTMLQRWSICGIMGGGLGNLIDRFFRPDGVVDFVDCIWFGIGERGPLSMKRWPTFNVADIAVVVCAILFVISYIIAYSSNSKKQSNKKAN